MATPLPGSRYVGSVTEKQIFWNLQHQPRYVQGVIDNTQVVGTKLLPGTLMAQITATRKWVPLKRTVAVGAGTTITALIVRDASNFAVGDTITVGSTSATVSAVNYTTNTITLAAAATWTDGNPVFARAALAGAETARAILDDDVNLIDLPKRDGSRRDMQTGKLCFDGCVKVSAIVGDLAAATADVNHKLQSIKFDDAQGYRA